MFERSGWKGGVVDASPGLTRLAWRVTHLVIATFGLVASAAAQVSDESRAVGAYAFTPGRTAASMAALAGLVGVVVGGVAFARSVRRIGTGEGRRGAIVALAMGTTGLVVGAWVVATASGGLGTGNGLGGGVVAVVLGLVGMALGGLVLARSRRTA